jgi:amidase
LKDEPSKTNSALVKMLLKLGAVLYVKTNIPQTMMVSLHCISGTPSNPQTR